MSGPRQQFRGRGFSSTSGPTIKEHILDKLSPAYLISIAAYHFLATTYETAFRDHNPRQLLSLSTLRDKAFSRLWLKNGEALSADMPAPTTALLSTIHGVVLDIGPGSGTQLSRFNAADIEVIYGAEPVTGLHDQLLASARQAGLGDKYRVLSCGAEPDSLIPALERAGLLEKYPEGIFDDIVCVRVLCGIDKTSETVEQFHRLLKPGGRILLHEHTVNPWRREGGSVVTRAFQFLYQLLGWSFWMGNCRVDRDTETIVRTAADMDGGWAEVNLQVLEPWSVFPYLIGSLKKRGEK